MLVRPDLPRGLLAAQVVHAAGESASETQLKSGTYAVVLQATGEQLHVLAGELQAAGVEFRSIVESDPPYAGELMAIGLKPAPRAQIRRYVSSFPLLR